MPINCEPLITAWCHLATTVVPPLTATDTAFLSSLWTQDIWVLGLLLTLTFFGNDLTMGPAWAACADVGERYTGTLSGAMNMIAALAGACGTALAGYLFRQGQPELVFIIFSCVYVMAALCWLGVDVTQRLADAE